MPKVSGELSPISRVGALPRLVSNSLRVPVGWRGPGGIREDRKQMGKSRMTNAVSTYILIVLAWGGFLARQKQKGDE